MRDTLSKATIAEIFRRFRARNPHPKSELIYHNTYTLLVAVVLSAQATDQSVNRATQALFAQVDSPKQMLDLGQDALSAMIRTIGLYKTKAKHIIELSQRLVSDYDGQVPHCRKDLEGLPGVGRKTANVILNVAFGQPVMAVDTHIFRLGNRLQLAEGKTPREVEDKLLQRIPAAYLLHAHHWLILHGRYICKARRPECWHCLIADLCPFEPKTVPSV